MTRLVARVTTSAPPSRWPADSPLGSRARWLVSATSSQIAAPAARARPTIVSSSRLKATAASRDRGTSTTTATAAARASPMPKRKKAPHRRRPAAHRPAPGMRDPRAVRPRKRPYRDERFVRRSSRRARRAPLRGRPIGVVRRHLAVDLVHNPPIEPHPGLSPGQTCEWAARLPCLVWGTSRAEQSADVVVLNLPEVLVPRSDRTEPARTG